MANHSVWLYPTKFSHDHLCASGRASVDSRTCLHDLRLSWRGGGWQDLAKINLAAANPPWFLGRCRCRNFCHRSANWPAIQLRPVLFDADSPFLVQASGGVQPVVRVKHKSPFFSSLLVVGLYFHRISWNRLVS